MLIYVFKNVVFFTNILYIAVRELLENVKVDPMPLQTVTDSPLCFLYLTQLEKCYMRQYQKKLMSNNGLTS